MDVEAIHAAITLQSAGDLFLPHLQWITKSLPEETCRLAQCSKLIILRIK
jgi:hypothetical protein